MGAENTLWVEISLPLSLLPMHCSWPGTRQDYTQNEFVGSPGFAFHNLALGQGLSFPGGAGRKGGVEGQPGGSKKQEVKAGLWVPEGQDFGTTSEFGCVRK